MSLQLTPSGGQSTMNFPSRSGSRQPLHTRQITCQGYLRHDGLIDIESTMQDLEASGCAATVGSPFMP